MPVYEVELTVPTGATELNPAIKRFKVLGNYITHVEIIFPDGSCRKTRVGIFYGIRQLYPFTPGQWFAGNNETVKFDTLDQLPDIVNYLTIRAWNDGGYFEHTIAVRVVTRFEYELLERLWLKDLVTRLDILLRRIGVY